RSISNVPLGEECLAQWVDFSRVCPLGNIRILQTNYLPQITTPLTYNAVTINTPAWPLPPLPLIELQDSLEFFAEYDFTIKDKAWRLKMVQTTASGDKLWSTLIYQYHQSRLEVMCWLLNDTYDGNLRAGKYVPWAPAFDVGSSGKNVVSVTNFLLTKMKASHPHAPDNEDTNDSPFVLIYPDVIVIN
ncbi:hypothetical protein K504DRAFT_464997, partial [Pleomassaria siparia CBS 279.74]